MARRLPQRSDLKRLGVFGGTFDPIHYGHLICAEQLHQAIGLDLVLFVPCSSQPHKSAHVPATPAHRMEMARLATLGYDHLVVSDIEIERGGQSYTVDTVTELRRTYGRGVELWLLMGMDAYLDLPNWKDPDRIAAECSFGVACRPGYSKEFDPRLPTDRSRFVEITLVEISSSDVRQRLSEGRSIRFLVPDSVEEYIRRARPYS